MSGMRMQVRSGSIAGLAAIACLALAVMSGPAAAALPRTYVPKIIDTPMPQDSTSLGWGLTSGDVTGDNKPDMIIAQSNPPATGAVLDLRRRHTAGRGSRDGARAQPRRRRRADVRLCLRRDDARPRELSPGAGVRVEPTLQRRHVGPPDGIPEIIAGSRAQRVNAANTSTPAVAADPAIGRGYVFDGATRAVIKRIDMPLADRTAPGGQNGAQFGRMMMNPSGLAPCGGPGPRTTTLASALVTTGPSAERIGDVDGGGQPDIVITARNYRQLSNHGVPRQSLQRRGGEHPVHQRRQGVALPRRGHRGHEPADDPRHGRRRSYPNPRATPLRRRVRRQRLAGRRRNRRRAAGVRDPGSKPELPAQQPGHSGLPNVGRELHVERRSRRGATRQRLCGNDLHAEDPTSPRAATAGAVPEQLQQRAAPRATSAPRTRRTSCSPRRCRT